ncbi:hypothetical protein, partial [Streptomyces sp. NPDC059744]|uniref:hypothetical protein n=1 Tax=Streptomyces sp. NPDC059744 TaxID=3346929 RepID=UPI003659D673
MAELRTMKTYQRGSGHCAGLREQRAASDPVAARHRSRLGRRRRRAGRPDAGRQAGRRELLVHHAQRGGIGGCRPQDPA